MTETFTASNGKIVGRSPLGQLQVSFPMGTIRNAFTSKEEVALREYFQHEADERLGRERDPEDSDWFVKVFGGPNQIAVYYEPELLSTRYFNGLKSVGKEVGRNVGGIPISKFDDVARRYFERNSERKPWYSATQGDVWELDFFGVSEWVVVEAGDNEEPRPIFRDPHTLVQIELDDPRITAGTKCYPSVEK